MKQKIKEYLPLQWCKRLDFESMNFIKKGVDIEALFEDVARYRRRPTSVAEMRSMYRKYINGDGDLPTQVMFEVLCDLGSIFVTKLWSKNKQVFKFDRDFTSELVKTEDVMIEKDMFKYLPFDTFYVDISDNEELCKSVLGDGFFVTVRLGKDDYWYFHICKITKELYFTDVISVPNISDDVLPCEGATTVPIYDSSMYNEDTLAITVDSKKIDYKTYQILVLQILVYLSSIEPDIVENEETKRTYRKPVAEPKNKFSEIQKWDVGVRYGEAVRSWRKSSEGEGKKSSTRESTGHKKPHARRAHWHRYWYGKKGENRELRVKWVGVCFINVNKNVDTPVVIHEA